MLCLLCARWACFVHAGPAKAAVVPADAAEGLLPSSVDIVCFAVRAGLLCHACLLELLYERHALLGLLCSCNDKHSAELPGQQGAYHCSTNSRPDCIRAHQADQ